MKNILTGDLQRKALLFLGIAAFTALHGHVKAQDMLQKMPAEDLTSTTRVVLRANPDKDYNWTLIGINEKAHQQEKLNPGLNVPYKIWHAPLAQGRNAFRIEFTRPYMKGENVFHLYLKSDGNENTGRTTEGSHKGVDYMLTLINGDPNTAGTGMGKYGADGKSGKGIYSLLVKDKILYLSADMEIKQDEGASVFEYFISSYIRKSSGKGVAAICNFGYEKAVSEGEPEGTNKNKYSLVNPGMLLVNGNVPGWQLARRRGSNAVFARDEEDNALVIRDMYHYDRMCQTVNLSPGHYLFRALIKTNTFQVHLSSQNHLYRIPVGVSDDYKWVELPFPVTGSDREAERPIEVAISYIGYPPTKHPAVIRVKKTELVRLGETVLPDNWVENMPVDPLHGLKLLNDYPAWNRPGKVIFKDSFIGTELWLMTQEGKVDHSYVGTRDFSSNGKYLYIGFMKTPRGILRTDGSKRYLNDSWRGLVWLFPWERQRLPEGSNPSDWICVHRSLEQVILKNIVTDETLKIEMPSIPGFKLVENPCTQSSRGPNITEITHDTLVWYSEEKTLIGLSDMNGNKFRTFRIKSISSRPEKDVVYPAGTTGIDRFPISSVWGKAWSNWRNAVDRAGNRYYVFDINRGNFTNHPTNPYQVWALSLTEGDSRGLLRVVPNPKVTVTEHIATHSGGRYQPSYNWWELAAGLPRSGDNAILLLEDGTLIHMSALGMHSSFRNTIHVNNPYTGEVTFIGTHSKLDRISWPHEFRRDRDFAFVASHSEPASPLLAIDLENRTYSTAVLTNFHDYTIRYRTRMDKTAYHKPMFRPSPTPSPDFTKMVYFSPMLTGDHPDRLWADVYIAVVRYPQPPVNLRIENASLVWDNPRYHSEIAGFNVYRSNESGKNYKRAAGETIRGTSWKLPPGSSGFYAVTSVEYSGLESRMFSNEVSAGPAKIFRHFYQAETGTLKHPMVPFFEPGGAANAYGIAITDPEMIYRDRLEKGLTGAVKMDVDIPRRGSIRIMARVRAMHPLERESYTTGWPRPGKYAKGKFTARLDGKEIGEIPVQDSKWKWIAVSNTVSGQPSGKAELELETGDPGIAIDSILVTNDPEFMPSSAGNMPVTPPGAPTGLKIEQTASGKASVPFEWRGYNIKPPFIKLSWQPPQAPNGVRYYNIYRGNEKDFEATMATLLGSNNEPGFIDPELEAGREYHYRVKAVDSWGNFSGPSDVLSATAD